MVVNKSFLGLVLRIFVLQVLVLPSDSDQVWPLIQQLVSVSLPAAKRQGHAELWVEKLVMDFWSLKLLFIVSFGMFLPYFELL